MAVLQIFSLLLLSVLHGSVSARTRIIDKTESLESNKVHCTLFWIKPSPYHGEENSDMMNDVMRCVLDNDMAYTVSNVPDAFSFDNGRTRLMIEKNSISDGVLNMDDALMSSAIIAEQSDIPREGKFTVAVIRVTGADGYAPTDSGNQLSDHIFGTNGNTSNLIIGYQTCSGGKVNFHKGSGNGLINGVLDLKLSQKVKNVDVFTVEDFVTDELNKKGFIRTDYTHIMYIVPPEVSFGALAYAYLGSYLSVYKDTYSRSRLILMHEVGHNFDMYHSGEGYQEYADGSCNMGNGNGLLDWNPSMCFNAAKSWWFGWYSDRHIEINPSKDSIIANMISINDYVNEEANANNQYTVARIVGAYETDLYFMYNRKEGINAGVLDYGDEIVIVSQSGDESTSWIEAHLPAGSQHKHVNWNSSGYDLIIRFCKSAKGIPDYSTIIVFLEGFNDLDCSTPEPTVSPAPSSKPSLSSMPSISFEPSISLSPSEQPSKSFMPSMSPSTPPSIERCKSFVPDGILFFFGWDSHDCLLPECGGDCDHDNDCVPESFCYQMFHYQDDSIPGCLGLPVSTENYCVSRQFMPSSAPSYQPTTFKPTLFPVSLLPTITPAPTEQISESPSAEICSSSLPPGVREFFGWGPHSCLLPECGGHCDHDYECAPNSFCRKFDDYYDDNNGYYYYDGSSTSSTSSNDIPGCAGIRVTSENYCVPRDLKPSTEPTSFPTTPLPTSKPTTSSMPTISNQPSISAAPTFNPTATPCDVWTQVGPTIIGPDPFSGHTVALSAEGSIIAIGSSMYYGSPVRIFSFDAIHQVWTQLGNDIDGEYYGDESGSIAMSSDGSIVAIGAPGNDGNGSDSGHVRVYAYDEAWEQIGNDIDGEDSQDASGFSVALSSNGSIVAIGAWLNDDNGPYSGHVRVYAYDQSWNQVGNDIDGEDSRDYSGYSVALSSDGSVVATGADFSDGNGYRSGHVRVFTFDESWTQVGDDIDGKNIYDYVGTSVSLSSDGSIIAIGARGNSGYVRVYRFEESWTQLGIDIDDYGIGYSVALSSDGYTVAIGARYNGARVYKFYRSIQSWTKLWEDDDKSGSDSVAISSDGSIIAFGDANKSSVHVMEVHCPTNAPTQQPTISCLKNQKIAIVDVQTDSNGHEVRWEIRRKNKQDGNFNKIVARSDSNLPSNKLSTKQVCLWQSFCYKLHIIDTGKDGICCKHGSGYYRIIWSGKQTHESKFENKEKEIKWFGKCWN